MEEHNRSDSMDRVIKRNKELEAEVEKLRSQVAAQTAPVVPDPVPVPAEMPEEMLMPQKVSLEWSPEAESCPWSGAVSSDIPVSNGNYTSNASQIYPTEAAAIGYGNEEAEASQHLYTAPATPVWVCVSRSLFLSIDYQIWFFGVIEVPLIRLNCSIITRVIEANAVYKGRPNGIRKYHTDSLTANSSMDTISPSIQSTITICRPSTLRIHRHIRAGNHSPPSMRGKYPPNSKLP